MFQDNLFKKVEDKTNIKKETIISLANKLQGSSIKDEKTIREVINELSIMTNKPVSKEKEDQIVEAILKNKVPNNLDQML